MHAIRQELVPPSGISHAVALNLIPSRPARPSSAGDTVLCQLVVARSSLLRVFEVRQKEVVQSGDVGEKNGKVKLEEVKMEPEEVKLGGQPNGATGEGTAESQPPTTRTLLYLVREHRVHGIVTGLSSIRTLGSADDGLDRLLVSFKDAKIALLEWSDAAWDLNTVSIHTYERAPQVTAAEPYEHRPLLRSDPSSRVAVLLLPRDGLAVLPLYQKSTGLDLADFQAKDPATRDIPYSPSYVLDLPMEVDETIRHVIDLVFLPGFVTPTLAILYQSTQTCTGRLGHIKDATSLAVVTLDPLTRTYPLISRTSALPYDAFALLACPTTSPFGGVVIVCSNSLLHVDPAGKVTGLATSRWHALTSGLKLPLWDVPDDDPEAERKLEGARASWVGETQLVLWGAEGSAREIDFILDGRSMSALKAGRVLAHTVPSAVVCDIPGGHVLVGAEVGDSVLLKIRKEVEVQPVSQTVEPVKEEKKSVGLDGAGDMEVDEDDLYGDSALPENAGTSTATQLPRIELDMCDVLSGHGPVADMTFGLGKLGERTAPELIVSTPCAHTGVFSIFHRDMPVKVKRKVPIMAGSQGIWSLRVRREVKTRSTRSSKGSEEPSPLEAESVVIISTDATPSPGISRTIVRSGLADVRIESRIPTLTITAGTFFDRSCLVQVTVNTIRLLDADGKEMQTLKDTEGNKANSPIRSALVADPYVLVHREDGVIALYIAEPAKKKIRPKSLPSGREKTGAHAAASIFTDVLELLEPASSSITQRFAAGSRKRAASSVRNQPEGDKDNENEHLSIQPDAKRPRIEEPEDVKETESTHSKKATNGSTRSHRKDQSREREKPKDRIRKEDTKSSDHKDSSSRRHRSSLDSNKRHKESKDIKDSKESKENGSKKSRHRSERAETVSIQQAKQWLLLYNANGRLEIWSLPQMTLAFTSSSLSECPLVLEDEVTPSMPPPSAEGVTESALEVEQVILAPIGGEGAKLYFLVYYTIGRLTIYEALPSAPPSQDSKRTSLGLRFVKVSSRFVDAASYMAAQQQLPEARRYPIPMKRSLVPFILDGLGVSGVFQKGEEPCWIVGTRQGGLRIHSSPNQVVHSFTPTTIFGSHVDLLMYTEEGPLLMALDASIDISHPLPSSKITSTHPYSSIALDIPSGMLVAASSLKAPFLLFDEDEQPLWTTNSSAYFGPTSECSSLEVLSPHSWQLMHGYDFAQNEFVNVVTSVTLETISAESGFKDYIAVGTSVYRGEDLAVRGGTYIFEIIEVVCSPDNPSPSYKLKLLVRDEAKAPVTAICSLNGYLVSSMGLKLFVRAFEMDERLVGVAFMDVGVAVTSVTCLKNFLLVGDANRSVSFVAFQEDPFKLVLLARDQRPTHITNSSFIFSEDGDFGIIAADDEGALRLFDYDPGFNGVTHGSPLLCSTEFNGHSEHTRLLTVANRYDPEDMPVPRAHLIYGTLEGSFCTVMPVTGDVFKRLQLLSGQLTRSVQHFAGLNPRAFRTVRNEHLTRPLNRGILDGNLLRSFHQLDKKRQGEITRQIGTDTLTILRDFKDLEHVW